MSEKKPYSPPILRLLQTLARSVDHQDSDSASPLQRFVHFCQVLLWIASGGYALGLGAWLLWLEHAGDMWWCTWFFVYLPPAMFLFPLGLLVPLALLLDWRQLIVHGLCVLAVFLLYEDLEWHMSRSPREERTVLRVLSNNIGQHGKHALTPFVEKQDPDLILLQAAFSRGPRYVKQYGERGLHTVYEGEYVCASKHPVVSSELLAEITCDKRPAAARFVLNVQGQRLVVYNVHIASPRDLLGKLRGRGFIAQLLHGFGISAGRDYGASEQVAERLRTAEELVERIAQETDPVIVAGDFNIPARGRAYHLFAGELTDTFEVRGRGYGFTFPGKTRNPFSLFGPWLRLDLVFASKEWRVLDCIVEPDRPSQHRAVVATIELKEP
ncbi:MAG: hypothetical protein HN380_10310 [Victivallales bacterium]|jgi:vancomycin resistance protein VanJ|nr:hypothetical protein [Victivallales bacterium]